MQDSATTRLPLRARAFTAATATGGSMLKKIDSPRLAHLAIRKVCFVSVVCTNLRLHGHFFAVPKCPVLLQTSYKPRRIGKTNSGPNPWEFIVNTSKHNSVHFLSFFLISVALLLSFLTMAAFAQNPVPQIVGPVKPLAVAPGSGAFNLTVYGANFVSGAVVNWNNSPRSTMFVSSHELEAQILGSAITKNTAGLISVTNPLPGGGNLRSNFRRRAADW
jgi:hypothetical protein